MMLKFWLQEENIETNKQYLPLKFMFSKKATKIEEIFTVDLMVTTYCQIDGETLSIFAAFSETVNFTENFIFFDFFKTISL